jgi:tetratricopeptide (TPR) repeat protein
MSRAYGIAWAVLLLTAVQPSISDASQVRRTRPSWIVPLSPEREAELNAEIRRLSIRLGVRQNVLQAIADIVGANARSLSFEDLIRRVQTQAERAAELQRQLTELRTQVAQLAEAAVREPAVQALSRATAAFNAGRFDEADREFAGLETLRRTESEAAHQAWFEAVEARARIAELQLAFDRAEELRVNAAREERRLAALSEERQWRLLTDAALSRYRQGALFGDNVALLRSIELFRVDVLPLAPRDEWPDGWAATQVALGIALTALGERERDTSRLQEAVRAFRLALEVWSRSASPVEWAQTQSNLGDALQRIGERSMETAHLEEAVAAYRAALEIITRERDRVSWSILQNNLGNALVQLGQREPGSARLVQAIAAFRASLQETPLENSPFQWALRQGNLGDALKQLGNRESSLTYLEEAVTAYRASLRVFPRERAPLMWAKTQNGLGGALATLGTAQNREERLAEAATAFRLALEERRREALPLDWAETSLNLALLDGMAAGRRGNAIELDRVIATVQDALTLVIDANHQPLIQWGRSILGTLELTRRNMPVER